MGRIYRAQDVRLKRNVAIKVIDARHRADEEYRSRFEREAQAIAQLEHPHIVSIYRYGEVSGLFYIAMQYVEGVDLRTQLARLQQANDRLPFEQVLMVTREICDALDYAHSKGIIHRDVKPSNIMLEANGRAILTDFGLVLSGDRQTQGEVFGSPRYIAPEQAISSKGATPQSDLYALGVILYEMLTGQLPFDADDPLDVAMRHMSETPPPPRDIRPELSAAAEAVILQAIAKEPEKRFANGKALAEALAEALQPASAPTVDVPSPPPPPIERPSPTPKQTTTATLKKRPLPPIPAAVILEEAAQAAPPPMTKPPRRRKRRVWLWLLLLVMIIIAGGAALAFLRPDLVPLPGLATMGRGYPMRRRVLE
jgi:serine/threonine protein kinase